jgi:hypothetical protein
LTDRDAPNNLRAQAKRKPVPDDEKHPDQTEPESPGADEQLPAEKAEEEGDRFRPEAIAERVGTLGEETDVDRIAREEEAKLTERKKSKKGKSALESAASKRLSRIGEGKVKRPPSSAARAAAASAEEDALLERTARLGDWLKQHQQVVGAIVAVGALAAAGGLGWAYWENKRNADASALLASAFANERGSIATSSKDKDDDDDDEAKPAPLYPTFKSAADRSQAALAQYRKVESKFPGTGAAMLARLSEGGILLDQGNAKDALQAYEEVRKSPLAMADAQVRGRALEGTGFAHELQAAAEPQDKDKHLDEALVAYRDLSQVDLKGFKELGKYHEARALQAKGDKTKAVELLKDVHKAVTEPGETHPFAYLQAVVEDRLRDLDPNALPPKAPPGLPGMGGPGGGPDMSDPRIREMVKQYREQMKHGGGGGAPPLPIPPPGGPQ